MRGQKKGSICARPQLSISCSPANHHWWQSLWTRTPSLSDLVSVLSWLLLGLINTDSGWLNRPSGEWEWYESHLQCKAPYTGALHLQCKAFVNGVKVVNDTVEKGISMLKSLTLSIRGQAAVPVAVASCRAAKA